MKFNLNLDNINYVKLLWQDINGIPYCRKAAIKFMGDKEMCLCTKFEGKGFRILTPQVVTVSFACENGLYRTTDELKSYEIRDSYVYFTLATPQGLEFQQNREYFRIKLAEKAQLSFRVNNEIRRIDCTTHDISANGIRLLVPEKIENLNDVLIRVAFKKREFRAKAKFVRFDDEDNLLKASFTFIELPTNEMDFISQTCIQKQLEYKRNSVL